MAVVGSRQNSGAKRRSPTWCVRPGRKTAPQPTLRARYNARAGKKTQRLADLRFIDELPRSAINQVAQA